MQCMCICSSYITSLKRRSLSHCLPFYLMNNTFALCLTQTPHEYSLMWILTDVVSAILITAVFIFHWLVWINSYFLVIFLERLNYREMIEYFVIKLLFSSLRWRERGLPFWSDSKQVHEKGLYSKFRTGECPCV